MSDLEGITSIGAFVLAAEVVAIKEALGIPGHREEGMSYGEWKGGPYAIAVLRNLMFDEEPNVELLMEIDQCVKELTAHYWAYSSDEQIRMDSRKMLQQLRYIGNTSKAE